ncbi:MAG: dockerin type I repeat-containing protein [Clostridia bacterium]|nr:dockerin type I repeat-containing protein [Clostridia bacterium]
MKKKLLCGILTLMMVLGVFISVSMVNASAAGAIYSVIDEVKTYQVDTYDELKAALEANETQRVIVLTGDIEANSTANISITPNLSGKKIVLDLNGYNIHLYSTHYLFRSVFTIDQAGQFHIINTAFDVAGKDNYSEISIDCDSGFVLNINNPQAEVSVMCGINLKSDVGGLCINACHRLYMYGVNIAADYEGIYFIESEKDIFAQSYFSFNNVVITTGRNCVDLRGIPELDIDSVDIDFNHVFLNVTSAEAAIISKQTQLVPKDFKHAKSADPVYTYNNGNSTDPILYSTLEDLRTDRNIAYFNHPFMANGTPCTHSNKADFLVTTRGHVVRCSDCCAYMEYTDHKGTMTSTPPSSYGNGYTSGINCACGYKTYYRIPSVKPPKFFENIVEVSSFEEIKAKAENASLTDVTLVLKKDITVNDDTKSYTIVPKVRGDLKIDLNGFNLIVNSDATTYLFDMSYAKKGDAGTRLCITNTKPEKAPSLIFNSSAKRNAIIHIDNPANRLFVANITLQNGTTSDTSVEAYTQTKNIYVESAYEIVLNYVKLINYKENGHNLCFSHEYSTVFKDTTVKIDDVEFESDTFNLCFEHNITDTTFKAFDIGNAKFVSDNSYAPVMVSSSSTAKLGSIIKDIFYISGENGTPIDLNSTLNTSLFDKKYEYTVEYNGMFACKHPTSAVLMYSKDFHFKACGVCNHITLEEHKKVDAVPPTSCIGTGTSEYINCDSYCGYKTEGETIPGSHKITEYKAKAATCSAVGYKESYAHCSLCGFVQVRNENNEVTATYTGAEATAFIASNTIPKDENNHSNRKVYEAKAATCSELGVKTRFAFCSDCGVLAYQNGKVVKTLKGKAATDFIVANSIAKDPDNHSNLVEYTKKDATCTEEGIKENFKFCDACLYLETETQKLTGDAAMDYFFNASIPTSDAHNYKLIEKKDATCTESGYKSDFWLCDKCNGKFVGEAKTPIDMHEFAKNIRLPAKGHTMEAVAAVDAKCTEDGNIAYYKCTREDCGKYYADDKGLTELAASEVVVKATGHTPVDIPGKAATETETGLTVGSKCSVCDEILVPQEEIPKLEPGHKHSYTDVVTAPTCKDKGFTTHTCACGDVVVDTYTDPTDAHTPVVVPGKAPTYQDTGLSDGEKCSLCGKILKEQEVIDKLPTDHTHEYTDTVVAPTCKDKGYTKHACVCGDTYIDTYIDVTDKHTPVIVPGKPATKTETGLTDGEKCSVCDKVLKEQTEIPKITDDHKHTAGDWVVVKPAAIGVEGKEQKKCTGCGEVLEERVIPALTNPDADIMLGDVNKDGKITAADARLALRISAKLETPNEYQLVAADMTLDKKITAADARKILRKSAKLE